MTCLVENFTKKIRLTIITSNSFRHKYLIKYLKSFFEIVLVIVQSKSESYFPSYKNNYEKKYLEKHFNSLKKAEKSLFTIDKFPLGLKYKFIDSKSLNDDENLSLINEYDSDYVVLFGCGILNVNKLSKFKDKVINLHLGLSPYFKGSATNFWAMYFNYFEYVGSTIHIASPLVDQGKILFQIKIDSNQKYCSYYNLVTRLTKKSIEKLKNVLINYDQNKITPKIQNDDNCLRITKKSEFTFQKLNYFLNNFEDNFRNFLKKNNLDK